MPKLTDSSLTRSIKVLLAEPSTPKTGGTASFAELRLQAGNAALAETIARLDRLVGTAMQDPARAQLWLRLCTELRDQKMRASAKALWKLGFLVLPTVPFEDWINAVPNPDSLEATRKSFNTPIPEFAARLLGMGDRLYETAGAEWVLQRGKPDEIGFLLDAALDARPRPRGLDDSRRLLASFLKKDIRGLRLTQVVKHAQSDEARQAMLTEIAHGQIALHAGKLALEFPATTTKLIERLFAKRSDNPKAARKAAVDLALFTSSILKAERIPPEVNLCLDSLAKIAAEIRLSMSNREAVGPLWTFEPIANRTEPGRLITMEGARQWALVYARAQLDARDLGYLESFASNVGLHEFAAAEQTAVFSPNLHDDTEGGLLTGDQVTVISPGWQFDGITIVKAKVRAKTGKT